MLYLLLVMVSSPFVQQEFSYQLEWFSSLDNCQIISYDIS